MVISMNRVKELLDEKQMKQLTLAGMLGTSQQTISRYVRGDRDLDTPTIRHLCEIFSCTSDYLLGISSRREPEISAEDAELLAAYHAASPEIRAIVDMALDPYRQKKTAAAG